MNKAITCHEIYLVDIKNPNFSGFSHLCVTSVNKTLTKEQRGYYGSNYDWLDSDGSHMGRGMMRNMGCCMMGETEMQDMCPMMSNRWR